MVNKSKFRNSGVEFLVTIWYKLYNENHKNNDLESVFSILTVAFTNVTKEEEGFWLCRARNMNGESVSCLHLIIAECNLNKKTRK